MDFNEGKSQLIQMFEKRDWFHEVDKDQYGRLVVYVKYMCQETLHDIPDRAGGIQVLVHFAASKTSQADQFKVPPPGPFTPRVDTPITPSSFIQAAREAQAKGIDTGFGQMLDDVVGIEEEEKSLLHLQNELNRLEKQVGSNTLEDIFYEIKDGANAVTNLSGRYPEVRKDMEKLFDDYGFDVIYEEI